MLRRGVPQLGQNPSLLGGAVPARAAGADPGTALRAEAIARAEIAAAGIQVRFVAIVRVRVG